MVEITPSGGAAQFAAWMRQMERRLGALETMRRTPFTDIYDEDGNLLGKLSTAGLQFFDVDGDPSSRLDGDGITVYDDNGDPITELDAQGLTVFDNLGVAQLRAGDLNGAGDYGVEVAGGRLRALDVDTDHATVINAALSTTPSPVVSVNINPPAWANYSFIFAWLTFQMTNGTSGVQRQRFRIDIDGQPGTGFFNNDVPAGLVGNSTDVMRLGLSAPYGSGISVQGYAGVNTGSNSVNVIRLHVFCWFLR